MAAPEKWIAAKTAIESYTKDDGNAIKIALAGWEETDRKAFLEFFLKSKLDERKTTMETESKQPPLTAVGYVTALKNVDFTKEASVAEFYALSHPFGCHPLPEPIRLGSGGGLEYFFQPQGRGCDVEIDSDMKDALHPYFVMFHSNNGKTPLLQYGLHLGSLEYSTSSSDEHEYSTKTPLQVFVNPEDRSIWLVLARRDYDPLGNLVDPIDETNAWPYLAIQNAASGPSDVICVYTDKEVLASTGEWTSNGLGGKERQMFPRLGVKAQMQVLVPYAAPKADVERKLGASVAGGSSGPSAAG